MTKTSLTHFDYFTTFWRLSNIFYVSMISNIIFTYDCPVYFSLEYGNQGLTEIELDKLIKPLRTTSVYTLHLIEKVHIYKSISDNVSADMILPRFV